MSRQIEQLLRCEIITEEEVKRLCIKAREILIEEANVQIVDSPVTVSLFTTVPELKLNEARYVGTYTASSGI